MKFIAGKNMNLTQNGQEFTYALNNNISLTDKGSLTIGNTTVKDGNITISNGTGSPVTLTQKGLDNGGNTITNVANGTNGTDAVNLDQLNATKTFVNGTTGVTVTSKTEANGSTTYTVDVQETPVKTTDLTANPNGTVKATDGDNLVNGTTVANAINNASWNTTSGATDGGVTTGTTT